MEDEDERWEECARCEGYGSVAYWTDDTETDWWTEACPECAGEEGRWVSLPKAESDTLTGRDPEQAEP